MAGSRCIWRPIHVLWVSADLQCIRDCSYQRYSAVWPATDGGDYFPADQAFGQPAGAVPVPDWNTIWPVFGILLGRSILPAALQMFATDYSGKNIEVSTLPYLGIIAGAILFSGLTVYISTRKSVKKASRVSPIEAIRYVEKDTVSIKRKR